LIQFANFFARAKAKSGWTIFYTFSFVSVSFKKKYYTVFIPITLFSDHQTRDCWSQFLDDLGEFPEDVEQNVTDLLGTWRKGEQFPQSLNEANAKVAEIEELYKAKV
jgi:hypothetical protein